MFFFDYKVIELGTGIIWFNFGVCSILDFIQCFYISPLKLDLLIFDHGLGCVMVFRDVNIHMLMGLLTVVLQFCAIVPSSSRCLTRCATGWCEREL